jgi:2-amino-4-hydroxy-6-hydroxymethyldihydropteridine diphosphokinase
MNKAYLLIGGNVGNRTQNLQKAIGFIDGKHGKVLHRSAVYETAAWGKTDQPAFLNQALELDTLLAADELMKALLATEEEMGRKRHEKYGPRIIDIDMLLFNDAIINTELLVVPHPQLPNRRFALQPLNDIAPGYKHPVVKKTIKHLLAICADQLPVKKFSGV